MVQSVCFSSVDRVLLERKDDVLGYWSWILVLDIGPRHWGFSIKVLMNKKSYCCGVKLDGMGWDRTGCKIHFIRNVLNL